MNGALIALPEKHQDYQGEETRKVKEVIIKHKDENIPPNPQDSPIPKMAIEFLKQ